MNLRPRNWVAIPLIAWVVMTASVGAQQRSAVESQAWIGVLLSEAVDGTVSVAAVVPDGPAEAAGLRPGDLLLLVGEAPIVSRQRVTETLRRVEPGTEVKVRVRRDGTDVETIVIPAARPLRTWTITTETAEPRLFRTPGGTSIGLAVNLRELVGLDLTGMSPELRAHYGSREDAGFLVTQVGEGRPASIAGVQVGDVLESACGRPLRSAGELRVCVLATGPGRDIPIGVVRAKERLGLTLRVSGAFLGPSLAREPPLAGRSGLARAAAESERAKELRERVIREEIARLKKRLAALEAELERLQ